jgi:hypothetical protein
MQVYSYVIDHDPGFAPNPFHGICTLAGCKPKIRQYTEVGDYRRHRIEAQWRPPHLLDAHR